MSKTEIDSEENHLKPGRKKLAFLALCSVPLSALTAWAAINTTTGQFSQWVEIGGPNTNSTAPTLAIGWANLMVNSSTIAVGEGNIAGGTASVTVGNYLHTVSQNSMTIGTHNQPSSQQVIPNGPTILVLSSGNGIPNDDDEKRNVMEVYKDGTIIINDPQGEVSMGVFEP